MVRIYEFKREARISEITELLNSMQRDGEQFIEKKVITAIMLRYNVSQRTASQYLRVAQYKNEPRQMG